MPESNGKAPPLLQLKYELIAKVSALDSELDRWLKSVDVGDSDESRQIYEAQISSNPHPEGTEAHYDFIPDLRILLKSREGEIVLNPVVSNAVALRIHSLIGEHNRYLALLSEINAKVAETPILKEDSGQTSSHSNVSKAKGQNRFGSYVRARTETIKTLLEEGKSIEEIAKELTRDHSLDGDPWLKKHQDHFKLCCLTWAGIAHNRKSAPYRTIWRHFQKMVSKIKCRTRS
jgi:hypothetical protein